MAWCSIGAQHRGAASGATRLERFSVELAPNLEFVHVDAVEATNVNHGPRLAVARGARTQTANTAHLAERMMYGHFSELVVGQRVVPLCELRLRLGNEGHDGTGLSADGAIAGHEIAEFQFRFEPHRAAVAAALILGHE